MKLFSFVTSLKVIRFSSSDADGRVQQWGIDLLDGRFALVSRAHHVEIIAYEGLLSISVTQYQLILFHVLYFCVFGNTFFVVVIVFLDRWREERCWESFFLQFLPVDLSEPRMVLDLLNSVETQSLLGLALNETIYEVDTFPGPAKRRDFVELNLFSQYLLSNLLSILTNVRSLN